jgi:hypothetical protein
VLAQAGVIHIQQMRILIAQVKVQVDEVASTGIPLSTIASRSDVTLLWPACALYR